jgi:hypothetical protein
MTVTEDETTHDSQSNVNTQEESLISSSELARLTNVHIELESGRSSGRSVLICDTQSGARIVVNRGRKRPDSANCMGFSPLRHSPFPHFSGFQVPMRTEFCLKQRFESEGSLGFFIYGLFKGYIPSFLTSPNITQRLLRIMVSLDYFDAKWIVHVGVKSSHYGFDSRHRLLLNGPGGLDLDDFEGWQKSDVDHGLC